MEGGLHDGPQPSGGAISGFNQILFLQPHEFLCFPIKLGEGRKSYFKFSKFLKAVQSVGIAPETWYLLAPMMSEQQVKLDNKN